MTTTETAISSAEDLTYRLMEFAYHDLRKALEYERTRKLAENQADILDNELRKLTEDKQASDLDSYDIRHRMKAANALAMGKRPDDVKTVADARNDFQKSYDDAVKREGYAAAHQRLMELKQNNPPLPEIPGRASFPHPGAKPGR